MNWWQDLVIKASWVVIVLGLLATALAIRKLLKKKTIIRRQAEIGGKRVTSSRGPGSGPKHALYNPSCANHSR